MGAFYFQFLVKVYFCRTAVRFVGSQKRLELFTQSNIDEKTITVPLTHTSKMFDTSWHKLGISVRDKNIVVFIDCDEVEQVAWPKQPNWGKFDRNGETSIGQRVGERLAKFMKKKNSLNVNSAFLAKPVGVRSSLKSIFQYTTCTYSRNHANTCKKSLC